MAYEKNTWATGDVVTSAKLNHMEDGIAGGYLIITATDDTEAMTVTLDKTWNEIKAALDAKIPCFIFSLWSEDEDYSTALVPLANAGYTASFDNPYTVINVMGITYYAASPDGYPVDSYA